MERTTTFRIHKGHLACDPRGAQVTMRHQGRTLLGDVVGLTEGGTRQAAPHLRVRFFNGEPWPIEPAATAVRVLVRREG
jgi:hypothetical protein